MGRRATPFTSVLCGVEGSPASVEAARQAIALAAPGTALHFIAVSATFQLGSEHSDEPLQQSLDECAQLARDAGISASTELQRGAHAADVLLPESQNHDLLVLGSHGRSRVTGMLFGGTTSRVAHETKRPLLVAREGPATARFPKSILFASDGSQGSWAPARAAARIAAAFHSRVEIVHVVDGTHPRRRRELEAQVAEIRTLTGEEPALTEPGGHATQGIIEAARANGSSLVVTGRRGLHGIRALGSVSERIVHRARCSVLLIPAGEGTGPGS